VIGAPVAGPSVGVLGPALGVSDGKDSGLVGLPLNVGSGDRDVTATGSELSDGTVDDTCEGSIVFVGLTLGRCDGATLSEENDVEGCILSLRNMLGLTLATTVGSALGAAL